jgi:hypothetical protein
MLAGRLPCIWAARRSQLLRSANRRTYDTHTIRHERTARGGVRNRRLFEDIRHTTGGGAIFGGFAVESGADID